ncbi:MAG: PilZ domain-containing protein [Gemmatimonadetes bacterium]|nr:MAG: PilZ domain-containing protein [Gemmatimonadota bacterium]
MRVTASDRRNYVRFEAHFPIRLGDPEVDSPSTHTINVSAGGAYCRIPQYISPLTKLMVTMLVPLPQETGTVQQEVIQCEAIAVWVDPEVETDDTEEYNLGLWFSSISATDRRKIARYIEHHLPSHLGKIA